jgi:hypothetical protein
VVARTVVGMAGGLCLDHHQVRGRDLGDVREQVLRANRPHWAVPDPKADHRPTRSQAVTLGPPADDHGQRRTAAPSRTSGLPRRLLAG